MKISTYRLIFMLTAIVGCSFSSYSQHKSPNAVQEQANGLASTDIPTSASKKEQTTAASSRGQTNATIEELMAKMSVREKVAQLFIFDIYPKPDSARAAFEESLVKEYGGTELLKDYYAAVKDIRESRYYNIGLFKDMAENAYLNDYIKLPDTFTKIDLKTCRKRKLVEYLEKRKITQDIIDLHNIGYTTWDEDKYNLRNRIIIPSYDSAGDLNYWVGRDFTGNGRRMKYWNSKNDKNEIVFQESLIQWDATIYLCEGAIDCLFYPNSIALLGKTLSKGTKIFQELYDKARANIVICLDGDTELKETKRIYNLLNIGRLRGKIRYIRLGTDEIPYKDFGEIYEAEGKTGMIKAFRQAKEFSEIELLV